MGLKVYPEEIRAFTRSIQERAEHLTTGLEKTLEAIEEFEGMEDLSGTAWKGMKEQLAAYKYAARGIIAASDSMNRDAYTLESRVGEEELDEDLMEEKAELWMGIRENMERMRALYVEEDGYQFPDGSIEDCQMEIQACTRAIEIAEKWTQYYEERLEELRRMELETQGLFEESNGLFGAVEEINRGVAGSWNGSRYRVEIPEGARNRIEEGWKNTQIERELRREGVTPRQVGHMGELGYSPQEVLVYARACETEADREFLGLLMEGRVSSYEKAFSMDPGELSETMTVILSDYGYRLAQWSIAQDGCRSLEGFNRGILRGDGEEMNYSVYAQEYLGKLYMGSQILLEGNSALLLSGKYPQGELRETMEKNYGYMSMVSLWGSQYGAIESAGEGKGGGKLSICLELDMRGLFYDKKTHTFSYEFVYEGLIREPDRYGREPDQKERRVMQVEAAIARNPSDMIDLDFYECLGELREEKEKLKEKYVTEGVTDAAIGALTVANIGVGVVAGILSEIGKGSISGVDDEAYGYLKGQEWFQKQPEGVRGGIEGLSSLLNAFQGYQEELERLEEEEKELLERKRMYKWGAGGYYEIDGEKEVLYQGVYNPRTLLQIHQWESEGLQGLLESGGMEYKQAESRVDEIRRKVKSISPEDKEHNIVIENKDLKEAVDILLDGGNIYGMDEELYSEAVEEIEKAYISTAKDQEDLDWTIQSYFEGDMNGY